MRPTISQEATFELHTRPPPPSSQAGFRVTLVESPLSDPRKAAAKLKKHMATAKERKDMREEYDRSQLKGGVRGKYYRQANAGTNLVLIEPDLMDVFPDGQAVNRALRVLAESARTASSSKRRHTR